MTDPRTAGRPRTITGAYVAEFGTRDQVVAELLRRGYEWRQDGRQWYRAQDGRSIAEGFELDHLAGPRGQAESIALEAERRFAELDRQARYAQMRSRTWIATAYFLLFLVLVMAFAHAG